MKSLHKTLLCAPLAGLLLAGALLAPAARAADGKGVFMTECAECHSAAQGKNKKGPSMFGVAGRPAASLADYSNYSDALKGSKWQWTPAQLKTYLSQSSSKALPGTKMKYEGLEDQKELDALIAYLNTLH
ncbi:c-type cytochrome [Xanthomonas hortorum]|uniref:Cytochrome c2 n=1 Tax=Xanthomonas hortorum pv. pelargonii TaxID=453602 RepID=A0A6V7D2F1_9XANT|nr:c-type cytochrome [Xanthomonas hortorum]MCE4353682.1 c-type cytochrome [Xanthomonas hortorum pv. pelargonii]MCM5525028.1 c-type cytochrome [Xanthomonas hortorum pv. pelargonii]MCM5537552.1 c-type cytochrome [Xanthomonas hortorum pv. pelargonii]MCM5541726.1 c-type cytochrome [Xanthomonas hortorum pv. pelargonii]MCM5545059.1 c-type cytochrome [Xanthomonas hortorum pv. pelargonii]